MRSYEKAGVVDAIRAAGGEVFAVTSEPQTLATEAESWGFGFPSIGDPHHELLDACRNRGWVEVFANENYGHLRLRPWASHPKGYYQPAVVAVAQDGRVLYRWRCRPQRDNMSGAGSRPEADYVWEQIQAGLEREDDAPLDTRPVYSSQDWSWPRFVLVLLAHGWFLRPRAFPLARPGDKPSAQTRTMMRRVALFAGAWVAAFALLPTAWVAGAFALWALVATAGIVELHRQFQHVPGSDAEATGAQLQSRGAANAIR